MTENEMLWQQTVLQKTEVAADQFWQFGSPNLPSETVEGDVYTITYGTQEYQILGTMHAEKMLEKDVGVQYD